MGRIFLLLLSSVLALLEVHCVNNSSSSLGINNLTSIGSENTKDKASLYETISTLNLYVRQGNKAIIDVRLAIGGNCRFDWECDQIASTKCIDEKCQCNEQFYEDQGQCVRKRLVGLGVTCSPQTDFCIGIDQPEGDNVLECSATFKCDCIQGYVYHSRSNLCREHPERLNT